MEGYAIEVISEDGSHAEGFINFQTLQNEKWEESILARLDNKSHIKQHACYSKLKVGV